MADTEAFAPATINDLNLASKDQLIDYLTVNKVPFGESELKPELLARAREHFASKEEKKGPAEPKLTAPSKVSEADALVMLQTKGFKDKDEIVHYINSLERKEADLKNRQIEIDSKVEMIEKKEIEFEAREAAIKKDVERFVELNNQNDAQLTELNRLRGKG